MTEISQLEISQVQSESTDLDTGGPEWSPVSFLQNKGRFIGGLAIKILNLGEVTTSCSYINKALYESAKSCAKFRERLVKSED